MASGLLGEGPSASVADVRAFMDSDVPKYISELVNLGVLVSVGSTRDRGAISLTVTLNGDWDREYFRDSFDAIEWLQRAVKTLRARGLEPAVPEAAPTQKPRRRSRTPL